MTAGSPTTVYELIGDDGFTRLAAAFYRQIPNDELLGPMYPPDDLAGAEQRLASFLIYRFGGPPTYLTERGHPALRMRHAPFVLDQAARDRWVRLMSAALAEVQFPPPVETVLRQFFEDTATFLINHPG